MIDLDVYCKKYGFTKDKDMLYLNRCLTNKILETISIDVYTSNPYMLMSRMTKENSHMVIDKDVLAMYDDNEMVFINILKKGIDNCVIKVYDDSRLTVIMSIHNLIYRIFIEK